MTEYVNPFASLNTHLKPFDTAVSMPVYTQRRNPPVILCHSDELKQRITSTFKMSYLLFEPHDVHYVYQQIESSKGPYTKSVIDVNYMWSGEYYHFLTEVLPNVLLVNQDLPIYCSVSQFTIPMFRWFGITSHIQQSRTPLTCWIRPRFVECGNPSPEKIKALRDRVCKRVIFQKTHGILIHRRKSRRIINESDVLTVLKDTYPSLTWEVFDILSVEDTAILFSKAALIVGPHGAGFTNMIFSQSVNIVEFMPLAQPNICYWHLSEVLGNTYRMIPVPSEDDCMNVDCTTLKDYLNNVKLQ
jgi:hypothetical protein